MYINYACDTVVIGLPGNSTGGGIANGCNGASWGVFKLVNNRNESLRIYLDESNPGYNNYDLFVPRNSTRYYYGHATGAYPYVIKDISSTTIDQGNYMINTCDTAVVNVN